VRPGDTFHAARTTGSTASPIASFPCRAISPQDVRQLIGGLPQPRSVPLLGCRVGQVQEVGPGECGERAGHEASKARRDTSPIVNPVTTHTSRQNGQEAPSTVARGARSYTRSQSPGRWGGGYTSALLA
jgi:hypothetical protein